MTTESKTARRIYKIRDTESRDDERAYALVRATNPAQAIRHVVRDRFTADVASQDDLVELVGHGLKVQTAGDEAA